MFLSLYSVICSLCSGQWATLPDEDTDRQQPPTTDLMPTGEYDEEEEEDGDYAEEEEESEESEGENEMVVLDPDHVSAINSLRYTMFNIIFSGIPQSCV